MLKVLRKSSSVCIYCFISLFLMTVEVEASQFIPLPVQKQLDESTNFIFGEVRSKKSYISGKMIYTNYFIHVLSSDERDRSLVNTLIKVRALGGQVGDKGMLVSGSLRLSVGEDIALMLTEKTDFYYAPNMKLGSFKVIEKDGKRLLLNNAFPKDLSMQVDFESHFSDKTAIIKPAKTEDKNVKRKRTPSSNESEPTDKISFSFQLLAFIFLTLSALFFIRKREEK